MIIIDFVSEKEKECGMKKELVEKDFGYIPFFDFITIALVKSGEDKTFNNSISIFSLQARSKKDLDEAWDVVYKKYRKYFD